MFGYRKSPGEPAQVRTVQPWGLVSWAGRWYLVGFDTARRAQRTFRLSRIAGEVRGVGRAAAYRVPAGLDLLRQVADSVDQPARRTARLLVRTGTSAGLRRHATPAEGSAPTGWDRIDLPVGHLWDTARTIAGNGPDVVVQDPADLRDAVIRLLRGAAAGAGAESPVGSEPEPLLPGLEVSDGVPGG